MVSISLGRDFHIDPYFYMMSEALSIAERHRHKKKAIAIVMVKLATTKLKTQ